MKYRDYHSVLESANLLQALSAYSDWHISYKITKDNMPMLIYQVSGGRGTYTKKFFLSFHTNEEHSLRVTRKLNIFDIVSISFSILLGIVSALGFFSIFFGNNITSGLTVGLSCLAATIIFMGLAFLNDRLAWRKINKVLLEKFNCQIMI